MYPCQTYLCMANPANLVYILVYVFHGTYSSICVSTYIGYARYPGVPLCMANPSLDSLTPGVYICMLRIHR